jgi:hypothetical protein
MKVFRTFFLFDNGRTREAHKLRDPTNPDPLVVALVIFQNVDAHQIILRKFLFSLNIEMCKRATLAYCRVLLGLSIRGLKEIFRTHSVIVFGFPFPYLKTR